LAIVIAEQDGVENSEVSGCHTGPRTCFGYGHSVPGLPRNFYFIANLAKDTRPIDKYIAGKQ